jgi:hypothetical protein
MPLVVGPGDRLAGARAAVIVQWVFQDGVGCDLSDHIVLGYIRSIHPQVLKMCEGELRLIISEQDAGQILALQHYMINLKKKEFIQELVRGISVKILLRVSLL